MYIPTRDSYTKGQINPINNSSSISLGSIQESIAEGLSFGSAIEVMKLGHNVARKGWIDDCIFIALKTSDEGAVPCIYTDALYALKNKWSPPCLSRVVWFPSQEDMLALDWRIV